MKLPLTLLTLLLAMGITTVLLLQGREPPNSTGLDHPTVPEMRIGGPGPLRHAEMLFGAGVLGTLLIAFLTAVMAWGCCRDGRLGPTRWWLVAGFLACTASWWVQVEFYRRFLDDPTPTILGLPEPSFWIIFVFEQVQFVFLAMFVVLFPRWFWRPEDQSRFEQLLEEHGR
jgi:hypothetical protein